VHAHHLRFAQPRAMGNKVSDEWSVPLCFTHHRALHTVGDEEAWWVEKGIDAKGEAQRLWRQGHGIPEPTDVEANKTALPDPTPPTDAAGVAPQPSPAPNEATGHDAAVSADLAVPGE